MQVLALSRYGRRGASSRLRFYQYASALADRGLDLTIQPLLPDSYLDALYSGHRIGVAQIGGSYLRRCLALLRRRRVKAVWVEYEMFPWLPPWAESLVRSSGKALIAEYDDAVYLKYQQRSGPLRLLSSKIDRVMRMADLVIVGNELLATYAHKAGASKVAKIPTVVDLSRYGNRRAATEKTVTIGWIGTPLTARYLSLIEEPLHDVLSAGDAQLMGIGLTENPLTRVPLTPVPWSEADEPDRLAQLDIGIMPLPDAPWERGKCAYKIIQYMAASLPVVASPVGANSDVVLHGETGFLAESASEWVQCLRKLVESQQLRREFGDRARARVEEKFSISSQVDKLAAALKSVIK